MPALGVDPATVSRDPAEVEAYRTDPLVHHGKLPVRTVAEIAAATEAFPEQVGSLTLPLLLVHGSEDRLVSVQGSRMVYERASSEDKTLEIYDGLFHEVLNELPEDRQRVLARHRRLAARTHLARVPTRSSSPNRIGPARPGMDRPPGV